MTDDTTPADDVPGRFSVDFTGQTLLGTYLVEEKLAEGGMGAVYRGVDTNLGRPVVIKVPHIRFVSEPGFRQRFHREIGELVRLEHPHIVRILAQGEQDEVPFFVLQFLGGGSLEDVLDLTDGSSTAEDILGWLPAIARTLDFVHARGTVHRDVKPANILFDEEGHVFLSDFGVAKALESDDDQDLTDVGTGVGSPRYMAPEQITGGDLSASADQYALASTLYEALVGRPPFEGGSTIEMLMKKRAEDPEPLSRVLDGFNEEASLVVQRALARDPHARFPSCSALSEAFEGALAPPAEPVEVSVPSKGPIVIIGVLVSLLLVAGVATLLRSGNGRPEPTGGATNESPQARLTLLDPGSEPRRALRYHVPDGHLGTLEIQTGQQILVTAVGQDEPIPFGDIKEAWTIDFFVENTTPAGDIQIRWETAQVQFDVPEGEQTALPKSFIEQYKTFGGTLEIASNGITLGSTITAAEDVHTIVARDRERMDWTVRSLPAVFPTEPVGVGARWEVSESISMIGMRMTHTTTYEVTEFDGDQVHLQIFVAQTAAQQEISMFGEDLEARLLSLHANGNSEAVADLSRIYSDRGVYDMDMQMEMRMKNPAPQTPDDPAYVESKVDVKVHVETTRK